MDDCVFCKIVKKELPSEIDAETESLIAFRTIQPVAKVHILVTPKKHISGFMDIEGQDKDIFMEMVRVTQMLIKDKKIEKGYKLVFNGGVYQKIPHLHWHLLGGGFEKNWENRI